MLRRIDACLLLMRRRELCPYVAGSPEIERAMVGSSNQRFIQLTDRYADYEPKRTPGKVELRILSTGEVSMAGFATTNRLAELADALGARRSFAKSRSNTPRSRV